VIQVIEGVLADLAVHAVVRAADDTLQPLGPVSAALDAAAGTRGADQRRSTAPLEVGAAVITGAGDLSAEFILHLVLQGEGRPASADTVHRALDSAWHRAEGWQLPSVAAALSGLLLPDEEAARLLVETFHDRPGTTGFPSDLYVLIDRPEQRGAVTAWLGNGAR